MAHRTAKDGYRKLEKRLNRFPQGAPPSEYLYKILRLLMNHEEAEVMSLLPIKPFTVKKAARALGKDENEAAKLLDDLAQRALLVDLVNPEGKTIYTMPPPMAGFFEFSLMRTRNDIDQKLLSELFYQYLNVEEDFVKSLFTVGETKLGRVFVQESAIRSDDLTILDYERASHIIKSAKHIGLSVCYCRHKKSHVDGACDAPMDICMTFGNTADSLIRHGYAERIDAKTCMAHLERAYEHNLVQIGENEMQGVPFICNCCGCCCEALLAVKRFGTLQSINTTNFLPVIDHLCTGCGLCVPRCPVDALTLADHPSKPKQKLAVVDEQICLGCGVCVRVCKTGAIYLENREKRVITPVNSVHRILLMAIERGKLQHLIFDNQAHASHRALAAVFGAILKLPPIKQIIASEQVKSKYLGTLIQKIELKQS